jgi:1,4-dihydroxy-2-naphthoyl-CoA hydrolase
MIDPWEKLPEPQIPFERTFEAFLGLEWLELSDEIARVRFAVRDDLKQPLGLLHGGVYSAVAETVASVATARAVWQQGLTALGMSNNATFMRSVRDGVVNVTCRLVARNDDRRFWVVDFADSAERRCSSVQVTIAVRPRRPEPE